MTSPRPGAALRSLGVAVLLLAALTPPSQAQTLVVAYSGDNAVGLVDVARSRVAAVIPVGRGPHEIAMSSDGRLAYVANTGGPTAQESNVVSVVDVHARRVARTIDLGECKQPHDLRVSPGDSLLWVTCASLRAVLEVHTATGNVRRRWDTGVEGGWMLSPTPDGRKVYVANLEGKGVSAIDRVSGRVRTVTLDAAQMGIDVSPDGRELWVASAPASVITVIDTRTDSVLAEVPSGAGGPLRVKFTPDGAQVLVPHRDSALAILDAATRRLVHVIRLPLVPKVIALSPDGRRAAVSNPDDDRVTVIDLDARRVIATIAVGKTPDGVAWAGAVDSVTRSIDLSGAAVAQYRGRRYADAAETFARAAALAPHDAGMRYNAALASAQAGRDADAVSWLHRMADLGVAYPIDSVPAFDSLARRADIAPVRARLQPLLAPLVRSQVALTITQRDLQPESIAIDSSTGAFYVGSIYRRKILRVRGGVVEDLVPEGRDGLWGVLGMKLDHARRELLVNACNLGDDMRMARPDSATVGRAGLFRYDPSTGRLIARHIVGDSAGICFNDLTIAPNGDAFISAGSEAVHRFDRARGTVEPFLASPELQVNGIALSDDGRTLYLANGRRGISAVDVATRELRTLSLSRGVTLHWIDGLYVRGNILIGIQNGTVPERVIAATVSGDGRRIERVDVLESNHPLYADPTTGAIVGDTLFYVATTQLRVFDAQGRMLPREQLKDNVILRLPLPKRPLAIRWDNGRWFNGERFEVGRRFSVDGRLTLRTPARVDSAIDLRGRFVIPPMGDAHQHTLNQAGTVEREVRRFFDQGVFYVMVQDALVEPPPEVKARLERPDGVDVVYTRAPLLHPGHALTEFFGRIAASGAFGPARTTDELDTRAFFLVRDSPDLDAKWAKVLATNDRLIKVILAFSEEQGRREADQRLRTDSTLRMARPGVDPRWLPRIVELAHAAGRRVSVHVETAGDFRAAVLARADFVAHLPGWHVGASTGYPDGDLRPWLIDPSDARRAAELGIGVITTTLPKPFLDNARYGSTMRQVQRANLETLAGSGARILIGADQGTETTPAELKNLASLGALTNLQLLRSAVEATPQAIFPDRRIGQLAEGYEASFLVLSDDPLRDIANIGRIVLRVKRGEIVQ